MSNRFWDERTCDVAVEVLSESESYAEALKAISKRLKRPITKDALVNAFRANGYGPPSSYLEAELTDTEVEEEEEFSDEEGDLEIDEENEPSDPDVALLMKAIQKKHHTLRSLCDEVFNKSPKQVEKVVQRAIKEGFQVSLHEGEIGFKMTAPTKQAVSIPIKKVGEEYVVGVFSDVHVGSEYHLKEAWVDHIMHCYANLGIRDFLCPGDLLEGCYKHARWELTHVGHERQAAEAIDSLPVLPGVRYHFIDGNHDHTFTDQIGAESGKQLVRLAREKGRNDIFFYGSRGAILKMGDTRIEMWHPKKGGSYALSYNLQNHIRDTEPQDRPHILLAGHWHQFCQVQQGGVYAVSCGTFQHHKGPFGKSLGGTTAIGGVVLRWKLNEDNQIAEFSAQHRPYPYSEPDFELDK